MLTKLENDSVILVGNWNLVLDQQMDAKNYRLENNVRDTQTITTVMQEFE